MRVEALVPFKCFTRAKQRLRAELSDAQVEALGRAMLADVLDTLGRAEGLAAVHVLTDDEAVASAAAVANARVRLRRPDPGLNPAIDLAAAELEAEGVDAVLVVLGDLPLLRPEDVRVVLEAGHATPVVAVPSTDGGTAMLWRRPPTCITARFGEKSARRHMQAAREAGLACQSLEDIDTNVRIDLDTREDLDRLLEIGAACRTADVLRSFEK